MNCGLGNLNSLKQTLLAKSQQASADYNYQLADIGLGVAALFDTFCNRGFAYSAADTQVFMGDRDHFYLPRFPVIDNGIVPITVNLRYFLTDPWTDISGQPLAMNFQTGLLSFGYTLGRAPIQVQVIYAGGYFFETLEPTDMGYPSAAPAGSVALPGDVRTAWLLQCKHIWQTVDPLGRKLIGASERNPREVPQQVFGDLDVIPQVKEMLRGYKRFQIT